MAHLLSNINILHGGQLTLTGQACSDSYKKALEEASEKGNAFVRYATELYQPSTTKSLPFIVEVLPSLSDAGIRVWQEYRKAKEEQRKEIKKILDNLKWKAFDEI